VEKVDGRLVSLKVLVVDDEAVARDGCRMVLGEDPEISAILEARDGREAIEAILDLRPDLVFLDIQMPEMDGFAVVEEVGAELMPEVVFVTAHDQYAVRAFEMNVIDYLMKPVPAKRWMQALTRAKARLSARSLAQTHQQLSALLDTITRDRKYLTRLAVPVLGKTVLLDVREIDWIEGAQNYARLHVGATTFMLHVPMNTLSSSLDTHAFLRIHRSTIVNLKRVKDLQVADHGEYILTLSTGARLRSGRTYRDKLAALLSNRFRR
jgi:two-component system LytT family response regulator